MIIIVLVHDSRLVMQRVMESWSVFIREHILYATASRSEDVVGGDEKETSDDGGMAENGLRLHRLGLGLGLHRGPTMGVRAFE